jgi:hypothetical protein
LSEPNTETAEPTAEPTAPSVDSYQQHGVESFEPMKLARPVKVPDEADNFEGNFEGLRKAAGELSDRREPDKREWQAKTPLPIAMLDVNTLEPKPPDQTLGETRLEGVAQGAEELTRFRSNIESATIQAAEETAIREMDAAAQQAPPEQPQAFTPEQVAGLNGLTPEEATAQFAALTPEQQAELNSRLSATIDANKPADANAELAAELERSPRLLAALQEQQSQAAAQIEQEKARYIRGLASNAATALQSVAIAYPELAQITDLNQIPIVVNTVAQSNPDRARAMAGHIQQVAGMVQQAQAAQSQYQQQQQVVQQQQFEQFAKGHDAAFEAYFSKVASPAEQTAIKDEALAMLREDGLSDADIKALWNTPAYRSVASQKAIMNAARYRLAQRSAKLKTVPRPTPTTLHPGSSSERASDREYALHDLNRRLNSSHSVKDATALLSARRSGRR